MTNIASRHYVPSLSGIYVSASPYVEALLRFAAGAILVPHGAQKLFGWFGGPGLTAAAAMFDKIGYSPGSFWAPFLGSLEFFGGILLAIGLFTRPVALLLFIEFLFICHLHAGRGFFVTVNGLEFPLLWAVVFLFFAVRGAGPVSVDSKLGREF